MREHVNFNGDGLTQINTVFELTKTTWKTRKAKSWLTVGYNAVAFPAAVAGYVASELAAGLTIASSLSATGHELCSLVSRLHSPFSRLNTNCARCGARWQTVTTSLPPVH